METKKIKIEIKNRFTGEVLFEYEKENNTVKETLVEAVKSGADLGGAYLYGANLYGAKNIPFFPMACPSDGTFIGWKKVKYQSEYYLVKLEILEDSKRNSATDTKCRCDKAKVLEITEIKTGKNVDLIVNSNYVDTTYEVGEMVYADGFDENRWRECSHGIHFFINRQEAVDYDL